MNVFSNFQKGYKQSYNTYIVNGFTFQSDMPDNLLLIKDPFHSSIVVVVVTQELLSKNLQLLLNGVLPQTSVCFRAF